MKRGGLVLGVLLLAALALGLWYFLLRGSESPAPVPQAERPAPEAPETRPGPAPRETARDAPAEPEASRSQPDQPVLARPEADAQAPGAGQDDTAQDDTAQDGSAQDGSAQDDTARDDTGRDELAEDDARQDASPQAQRREPEPSATTLDRPEAKEREEDRVDRAGIDRAGIDRDGAERDGTERDGTERAEAADGAAETASDKDEREGAAIAPSSQEAARPAPTAPEQEPADDAAEAARDDAGPSFDVVRVERDGSSVMAGRAAPGSEVVVRKDGEEVARGQADARGEFVILPERPLPPGDYALELEATDPRGETRRGGDLVVLSVPERPAARGEPAPEGAPGDEPAGQGALVVQVPADAQGETRVMQLPEPAPAESAGGLWLEAVDYDPDGALVITGQGKPGQRVVAYLDNAALGETQVGADGRWRLAPEREVVPGLYTLRIDQLDAEGRVTARVESPFARAAFETADLAPEERFVVIQPGNNLWTIARRTYGAGPRYTVIFDANEDQIRDPDLIYPGQIFVLPRAGQAG